MDYQNWEFLEYGDEIQKKAFEALKTSCIFSTVHRYSPILVGTFPLGIYTENSDLDIICEVKDLLTFSTLLKNEFSHHNNFKIDFETIRNLESLICSFFIQHFRIEVFVQNIQTLKQFAYLHMVKEFQILSKKGVSFKAEIVQLKLSGLSTEHAFAQLLNLKGDPYLTLLEFNP